MRKTLTLLMTLLLLAGTAAAQKSSLTLHIEGLPEGGYPILNKVAGDKLVAIDTLQNSSNSKTSQKIPLDIKEPTLFVLTETGRKGAMLHFMMEPGDKVQADIVYFETEDNQGQYKITSCKGSKNMEVYRQFNDIIMSATNPTMQALVPGQVEQLVKDNSNVLVSAFLVTYFEHQFEQYATLYMAVRDGLIKKYPTNQFVAHIDTRLKGLLLPGMDAPDIAMKDKDGVTRKLSDLRGNVVLVDFWASWCGPCRRENPNVVNIYKKYHSQGLEIYSVSLDKQRDAWLKAINDDGLLWPNHVSDLNGWTSSGGKTYGIMSIPATVLIDREGKIIARNLRGAELENAIAKALGN